MAYFGIPVGDETAVIAPLKPYSYLGTLNVSSSHTVQADDFGKIINITTPNVVITLPTSSTTPGYIGVNIIYTASTGTASVVTSGTDTILNQTSSVTSIQFQPGDLVLLVSNTAGAWWNISSSTGSISHDLSNNTDPTKGAALIGFYPGTNVYQEVTSLATTVANIAAARTKHNIAATSTHQVDFTVPGGYTLGELDVFMYNTYLVEGVDYTATNGTTVHLINPKIYGTVQISDIMTVSALGTYATVTNPVDSQSLSSSGGATMVGYGSQTVAQALDTLNQVRTRVSIASTSAGQTSFTVPGGYQIGKFECYMFNAYLMEGIDYTATDTTTITLINSKIYSRIKVGDPLIVTTLLVYAEGQNNVDKTALASSGGATLIGYGGLTVKQALDQTIVNRQQQYYTGITSNTITVTGGYTPGAIEVYLNGGKIPFGSNLYQATDGATVVFQHNLNSTDVVELLINSAFAYNNGVQSSQLLSSQAGLGASLVGYHQGGTVSAALDSLLGKPMFVQGTTTAANQTILPVAGGYTVGTVRTVATNLGLVFLHGDFTATDGQNIIITNSNITLPAGTVYEVEFYTPYVSFSKQIDDSVTAAQLAATQAQTAVPPVQVVDYPSLRSYTGSGTTLFVTGYSASASPSPVSGWFVVDLTDTTSADNGGTTIVDTGSRRWKRSYNGSINASWFTVGPNYTLNSAALTAAYSACLNSSNVAQKPLFALNPTIDTPIVFDGGDNLTPNADVGCAMDITILNATIPAGSSLSQPAITFRNARKPKWRVTIKGSGSEQNATTGTSPVVINTAATDKAVQWYNVEGADFTIDGYNFRGILTYYDGTQGKWLENKGARILARSCFCACYWNGISGTGNSAVGTIDQIWDVLPFFGSRISWLGDLSIGHMENSVVNASQLSGGSFEFSHMGSLHLGKVNLGNNAQYMMYMYGSTGRVDIDNLYVLGNGAQPATGSSTTIGFQVQDSTFVNIGNFIAAQCSTGMIVNAGTRMSIQSFNGQSNNTDIVLQKGGSTSSNVDLTLGSFRSEGSYVQSVLASYNLTGTLSIDGGYVRTGNIQASSTTAAIDLNSVQQGFYFTPGGLQIDTSWTNGVKHYYLGSVLAKGGNYVQSTNPLTDSFGHKGTLDLRSFIMPLPATPLVFGTSYQNTLLGPMNLYVPINFGTACVLGDWAAIKLFDPSGTLYDIAQRKDMEVTPTSAIIHTLSCVVPAGWSFQLAASSTATNKISLQGTGYWFKI